MKRIFAILVFVLFPAVSAVTAAASDQALFELIGSRDTAGVREVIENGQDVNVWGPDERTPLMSALFALSLKRWRDPRVRFGDMVPERQNIDEGTTSGK